MCFAPAPLAVAACLCVAVAGALAQPLPTYRRTPPVAPPAPPASAAQPEVNLTADDVLSHIGGVAQARGHVELQRLDIDMFTDYLQYDQLSDTAHAEGGTRVNRGLDWFTADRMDLEMQQSAGTMVHATYGLGKTGAGGTASRIEIIDADRAVAYDATFTGCPRNGDEHPDDHPDWVLSGTRIDIDTATNEGKATGAVLHFLGIPILAAPSLTFPVTAERKSGWLAPTADFSNSSGLTFGVPYYWNYSPNVDATLTPSIITRRGASVAGELRYLGANDIGQMTAVGLPDDRLAGYGRGSFQWAHEGERAAGLFDYSVRWQQVSDDQYWKDFPHQVPSLTQRLLPTDLSAVRRIPLGDSGEFETYARVQRWQTLQDFEDPSAVIQAPYQRSPQVGLRGGYTFANQLHVDLETEANRFDLEDRAPGDDRFGGERAHLVAAISREFSAPWGRIEPRLQLNGASYRTDEPMIDGRTDASRWIPTFSTDSSISLERNTSLFGHEFLQTLEPRLLYVYTPYRNQSTLPIYDTAAKDFNSLSIYSDNDFTGIDRVSDLNALVAGASTRFNDLENGREYVRLGVAQRFLFKDEEVAPDNTPDTRRVSDLLLWGSTSAFSGWNLDGELDFNPSSNWTQRAIVSTRYSPGPYRTLGLTYRYARGSSEQYEVSGQWPIYHRDAPSTSGCCGGTLYAVGRVNYSVSDSRANYAVGGVEYDAGCWVGRLIFERQSTGRSEATTHVILQLELIGLSTLGSGTLRVLKDNIPGYQPLHDESASAQIPR